jgi:hypothetical protein
LIFVFRRASSASARVLAEAIDGVRMKTPANMLRRARPTDKVIMWGDYLDGVRGRTLNNVPLQGKFEDALRLKEAGVRTVDVARQRPVPVVQPTTVDPLIALWEDAQGAADAFVDTPPSRLQIAIDGMAELVRKITAAQQAQLVAAPAAPPPIMNGTWLARRNNHVGGNDLLSGITTGDYYSKRENFVNEYRVHSFMGRSIRAGKKIPRVPHGETPFNGTPHEWIRSFEAGWLISYADDVGIKQRHRDAAHAAVRALGLDFGAVDIGELQDGTLVVLEVNRAPGVEGGTIEAYGRAIRRWTSGEWTAEEVADAA